VDDVGQSLMRAAMQQLQMSARAYHRILKLARTIADLAVQRDNPDGAPGGGDPVSAAKATLICRGTESYLQSTAGCLDLDIRKGNN
jgi:hypothetical protein